MSFIRARVGTVLAGLVLVSCSSPGEPEPAPSAENAAPADSAAGRPAARPARDLGGDRRDLLRAWAASGDAAELEIVRQHLHHADPAVRAEALALLDRRDDAPTWLERFVRHDTDVAPESPTWKSRIAALVAAVPAADLWRASASHARARATDAPAAGRQLNDPRLAVAGEPDFRVKESRRAEGGGVVDEEGLTLVKNDEPTGMVSFGGKLPPDPEDRGIVHHGAPIPEAWSVKLARLATAPAAGGGRWFVGDGEGSLVARDLVSGEVRWKVSWPLPTHAQLAVEGEELVARHACDAWRTLVLRFRAADGQLLDAHVRPRAASPAPAPITAGGRTIRLEQRDGRTIIAASTAAGPAWEVASDCRIERLWAAEDGLYALGAIAWDLKVLGRLRLEDGRAEWATPLRGGCTLRADDGHFLWLMNETSRILAVDRTSGAVHASFTWAGTQFSESATAFALDPATGRVLLDASAGVVTCMPLEALVREFSLKTPVPTRMSFEDAFTNDPIVRVTNLRFGAAGAPAGENDRPSDAAADAPHLFGFFANKFEESKFSSLRTRDWQATRARFSTRLVEKAKNLGLDHASLKACLEAIAPEAGGKTALVPVNAFVVTWEGEPAWVIVEKWEYAGDGESMSLGHVRAFVMSIKERKQLCFVTCG